MAFDLWTHEFCLACDKQTDGAVYCSESCRVADFEESASSSPSTNESLSWLSSQSSSSPVQRPASNNKFYLSPAYDFSTAQPYGRTPSRTHYTHEQPKQAQESSSKARTLTPSSSHSSLCSMQSTSSTSSETYHLSEKSRRELQAYAVSFEQVRLQRRRSY